MRVQAAGLLAVILTASCAVNVTTDGSGGSTPHTPAHHHAPPPPPPPPPAHAAAPAPAPAPAAVHVTPVPAPTQSSAVAPAKFHNQLAGQINLTKVQEIVKRSPKSCGYTEVSPGNWIHIDCVRYQPSTKAITHLSPSKLRLVQAHKHVFTPPRLRRINLTRSAGAPLMKGPSSPSGVAAAAGNPGGGGPMQIGESFPGTVDHRTDNLEGPIKNQGGVGSCTAHSLSATLDNAAIRAGVLTPGKLDNAASPLHVWSRYGQPNMGAAADGNIAQPVALYSTWPQSDKEACELFQGSGSYAQDCAEAYGVTAGGWRNDPTLMAKYDKSQASGVYKIAAVEKLQTNPPNMEELMGILASGADVWSAFLIDGRNWRNSAMTNAVIPDWDDAPSGHAVVISGYRDTPNGKQFLIHNSWGTSWGDGGYAWISEKMLTKNLYYAYKVKITNGVRKEDLTDDDCAPDELVDSATGLCAVMCKNDERPNNGCK